MKTKFAVITVEQTEALIAAGWTVCSPRRGVRVNLECGHAFPFAHFVTYRQ
jgi:hypothetical protein